LNNIRENLCEESKHGLMAKKLFLKILKICKVEQNADLYILHKKKRNMNFQAVLVLTNLHVLKAYNQRDSNYGTGRDMVV
jgi:hypothetical protein